MLTVAGIDRQPVGYTYSFMAAEQLVRLYATKLGQQVTHLPKGGFGLLPGGALHQQESRRRESHPPPLAEPGVSLSAHRAPIAQPSGRAPNRQCANRPGVRRATSASHAMARRSRRRNRLNFRQAHRARCRLSRRRK
jgi:hypothetical protein